MVFRGTSTTSIPTILACPRPAAGPSARSIETPQTQAALAKRPHTAHPGLAEPAAGIDPPLDSQGGDPLGRAQIEHPHHVRPVHGREHRLITTDRERRHPARMPVERPRPRPAPQIPDRDGRQRALVAGLAIPDGEQSQNRTSPIALPRNPSPDAWCSVPRKTWIIEAGTDVLVQDDRLTGSRPARRNTRSAWESQRYGGR